MRLSRRLSTLFLLVCLPALAKTESESPFPLFEISGAITQINQTFTINGADTSFRSGPNPSGLVRFTPVWRKKHPIFFHFEGTRVDEVNDTGITITGEHGNVKHTWSFGAHFGFYPLATRRLLLLFGLHFTHEAFLRDLGSNEAHLNKVLFPRMFLGTSVEWWRSSSVSMLLELAIKPTFSVPMDTFLVRNGLVLSGRASARWHLESFQIVTTAYAERWAMDTTVGPGGHVNLGVEVGVGWGEGD